MSYVGDFPEDQMVYIPFNTFTSDDPSASATITNLADADIKVHKDGNATEIVTDGATIAINFDGVTGNHLITIDTSIDAAYSTGSDYLVRINGTTVDGATINAWVGSFSIENRFREVDLTFIGGQAISGNNATLKLKQFDITNSAGTAFVCKSTGSDGHGMDIAGNGTGEGLKATGGATGHGIDGQGGASGGQGINAKANGGNGAGVLFQGEGTGEGLDARGGITGHGISGLGGATSGAGIIGKAQANNDAGMELVKNGTGKDLDADTIAADTAEIQGKLPSNKFMGSSDGADDDGNINSILTDTGEIGTAGAGLSNINLPNQTMDITGSLSGSVGSVSGAVGSIGAGGITAASIAANAITAAKLNADCITSAKIADDAIAAEHIATGAIAADAVGATALDNIVISDLAGIPSSTAKIVDAITILFMALRNKQTATDGAQTIANDAGATIATAALADVAGTTTKEEYA